MALVNYFSDDAARSARQTDVPQASFINGTNLAGSNAPAVGVNLEQGAVVGTPEQFTLLDQNGLARAGQRSQLIGGSGLGDGTSGTLPDAVVASGTPSVEGDGITVRDGNATLSTLAAGWVAV